MTSPLEQWLTPEELQSVAGRELFRDAQRALQRDEVVDLREEDDVLLGVVGSVLRYGAKLSVAENELSAWCSCPEFEEQGICRHPIALGLAWLQRRGAAQLSGAHADGTAATDGRPEMRSEILTWLTAHRVMHVTRHPLALLRPLLPAAVVHKVERCGYGNYPIVDKVLVRGEREMLARVLGQAEARVLHEAAWQHVEAEVALVEQGLQEEAALGASPALPPTDARLVPLVDGLRRARASVREVAFPRGQGAPKRAATWSETPPRIASREDSAVVTPYTWQHPIQVHVSLRLAELLDGLSGVHCTCTEGPLSRCVHALSALDDALAALVSPSHAEENARLAEALFSRGWTAVLDALAKVALPTTPGAAEGAEPFEVSFRVCGLTSGTPHLEAFLHQQKKRGGWTKGTVLSAAQVPIAAAVLPPQERAVLELLVATSAADAARRRRTLPALLRQLAGSPRLFLEERLDMPARIRELPLGFSFAPDATGAVQARPMLGGEPVDVEALLDAADRAPDGTPWLLPQLTHAQLTLVNAPAGAESVLRTLRDYLPIFPAEALPALAERLTTIERLFPVALPKQLEARRVPAERTLVVRLVPQGDEALSGALLCRPLPEAPAQVPGAGPALLRGVRGEERIAAERDLAAERAAADALAAHLGLTLAADGSGIPLMDPPTALAFLERLQPLTGPHLQVEWPERAWRLLEPPPLRKVKVEVRAKRDWFSLEGETLVDGEKLQLAALLDAARRRERYVPLGPGRFMRLTEELRERLSPLADIAWQTRTGLELSRAAAPVLEELREAGGDVQAPSAWLELGRNLREASRRRVPVPRGLKAELREYQREGFEWMARLCEWGAGGCLADEMGLGKTVQALALLLHRASRGPALVVAPTSVCANWVREAERFAPGLKVTLYHEADRRAALAALRPRHVLVVSYTLLAQHAEALAAVPFATLVVDEAQAVKNPDTVRARALRGIQAEAKVALTGTPVENRLSELWSLFALLVPGLLGSREGFRERYIVPIERERNADKRSALARALRPFVLRRTKAKVARELPPRIEVTVPVTLSAGERRLYEEARLAVVAQLGGSLVKLKNEERFQLLAAITRLRMLACHPKLGDASSLLPSSKTARLLELVAEARAEDGRVLVFSQFVKHLALVRQALEAQGVPHLVLDGSTPAAERARRVDAFQRGEVPVFLISLKAGGTGLNLTGADHVIHLDPWWNPAVEDQATDRAHRIGQTRPVTVSRLISEGTIEEAIVSLHAEKRDLAASLLSEADGAAALSTEQLMALLRYTGEEPAEGAPLADEGEAA